MAAAQDDEKNFHFIGELAYTEDKILIHNIFAYKIPPKTTKDEALAYFSRFGEVKSVRLVKDKRKTRKRAPKVGFIHYTDAVNAAKVLKQKAPHVLNAKRIGVRACDSWYQQRLESPPSVDGGTIAAGIGNPQEGTTFKLTMLNDDCLEHIIKKLPLKDQVRFSMTCQRFKNVFEMVCKTEHKSLEMDNLEPLTLWEVRELLLVAGPYMDEVHGAIPDKNHQRIIEFLGKFCRNVHKINLERCKLKPSAVIKLSEKLQNCTMLQLRDCKLNDHAILALKKLPKLEYLSVAENYELTGKNMEYLTTVKDLILYGCGNIQCTQFVNIIKCLKDLQSLDIQHCERLSDFVFEQMIVHCLKLESLKISLTNTSLECIARLPNLKKLEILSKLNILPVRQRIFDELAEHKSNQLESLKIVAKNYISLESARQIARITSLKILVCANNENLTDECLNQFADLINLEEIVLRNCPSISDEGLIKLIRKCTKLKKVNVQLCPRLTDQFVLRAIEVLSASQSVRGKEPCVFYVAKSGINSYMANHADYVAASALIKLSFHAPIAFLLDAEELLDSSDYSESNDDDWEHDLNDEFDDPYDDLFGVFSDAEEYDDDEINFGYNVFGNYRYDFNDYIW